MIVKYTATNAEKQNNFLGFIKMTEFAAVIDF